MNAAQERYNKRCPVISIRLTPYLRGVLDKHRWEGESYPNFITRIIRDRENIEKQKQKEYQSGHRDGYWKAITKAEECFSITFPCSLCGGPVTITRNDGAHQAIIGFARANGWRHIVCPNRQYQQPYQYPQGYSSWYR